MPRVQGRLFATGIRVLVHASTVVSDSSLFLVF